MAPNIQKTSSEIVSNNVNPNPKQKTVVSRDYLRDRTKYDQWSSLDHIIWPNVGWFALLHVATVYGIYLALYEAKWLTILFGKCETWIRGKMCFHFL